MATNGDVNTDVAIIGGGIIGSAIAYFLARDGRSGSITVIESDPAYTRAATPNGAGGVRQLFSLPENIWMSKYSLGFYQRFAETMAVDETPAEIGFRALGYLFLASKDGVAQMRANYRLQLAEGVRAELWDRETVIKHFPSVGTADVELATYSPDDGWFDPESALRGFRRKAERLSVRYVQDRVCALATSGSQVTHGRLESGRTLHADVYINAAGAWAGDVAQMVGMALPVAPLCRLQHYWTCRTPIEALPLVKDESGLFFRPEGQGFVGGRPSFDIQPGFMFDAASGSLHDYFEREVWPLLAKRVPVFEAIRCQRTWAGHYDENLFDGSMIFGRWTSGCGNFYVACGLSGHGIMHAPAVGLAMAELVLDGRAYSIDIARLGYERVLDNVPYREQGII